MRTSTAYLVAAAALSLSVLLVVALWGDMADSGAHAHGGTTMSAQEFQGQLLAQQARYGLPDGSLRPPPGSQVYVLAQQYAFLPHTLRLQAGQHYHLAFFSSDVVHGAALVNSSGGSLNAVILPGVVSELSVRASGDLELRCNEYCGIAHHLMQGRILVEDGQEPTPPDPQGQAPDTEEHHHPESNP